MGEPVPRDLVGEERVAAIEAKFSELFLSVDGIDTYLPYIPEETTPGMVATELDWVDLNERDTSHVTYTYTWRGRIHIMGYDRATMQGQVAKTLIAVARAQARNPKLDRAFSRPFSMENGGPSIPVRSEAGVSLVKFFRIVGEHVGGAL